ncbi:MAG: PKD domain-containing protein, partial [Bacteroidetes bacterium]
MKKYILLIFSFLFSLLGFAQYCVPISNCSDNDYIDDFYFNTISNTNTAGSNCNTDSYIYYTNLSTTVTAGQSYSISMQSGPDWDEGFGVWIDFNQDGDFDDMGEFVFASTTATTALVTGTVNIPSTAMHGPTRMRVRCRYGTTVNSSESCAQFSFGETEDYNVFIENAMPPVADFSAINSNCAPTVSFVDQSQYANSWLWDFGDGNTSTAQNPVHTYASPGNYTVSLTVTNNYGTDMVSYVINVSGASTNLPGPAQCTPQTIDNSLGFGITKVVFNTINNLSANSTAGYEDFTCLQTNLYLGYSYPITVELDNTAEQNVKVWIDFNNDGTFNETNELVVDEQQTMVVQTTITIPNVAITGQPLRMRVASDYYLYGSFTSCDDMNVGQVEDYSVIIEQNTNPPVADFEAVPPRSCDGVVEFIDQSLNIPTAYYWDFGDGNTSIASNPTHTYMNSGVYTVSMTTTNTYGSDMVVHNVTVDFGGNLKPAS